MKKLITLSIISILSGILLSSCGSNFSITKRHYNKGYFISRNHSPKTQASNEKETAETNKQVDPLKAPVVVTEPTIINESVIVVNNEKEITPIVGTTNGNDKAGNDKTNAKSKNVGVVQKSTHNRFQKLATRFEEMPIAKSMKNKKLSVSNTAYDGDGHSLFWIIILILLILWLVGAISTGFLVGSLINLVLLLALILLILWLLRVI